MVLSCLHGKHVRYAMLIVNLVCFPSNVIQHNHQPIMVRMACEPCFLLEASILQVTLPRKQSPSSHIRWTSILCLHIHAMPKDCWFAGLHDSRASKHTPQADAQANSCLRLTCLLFSCQIFASWQTEPYVFH